jgi:hypothetical protein
MELKIIKDNNWLMQTHQLDENRYIVETATENLQWQKILEKILENQQSST